MDIKKIEKAVSKVLIRVALIIIVVCLPLSIWINYKVNQEVKNNSAVYLFKHIDFRKLSREESDYLTFGWDMIDRFSAKSTRYSMSKEIRIKFLTKNWTLHNVFGKGPYDVPIIGIMEGALNPNLKHELFGEMGMFGQWPSTAKYYYYTAKQIMPSRLFSWVKFDFQKPTDLLDPINALKMAYIWLWIEGYNYNGDEMWTISAYRWGRFIGQHWMNKGQCEFPIKFVLYTKYGKKQYNPRAYYWTWRNMRDCFRRGDLDTGLTIYNKWAKKQDKLKTEQIEYRRLYRVLKQKEKEIKDKDDLMALYNKNSKDVEAIDKKTIRIARQIGGDAKREGWHEKNWKRLKDFCKELQSKFK